jgi:hypothetical protein
MLLEGSDLKTDRTLRPEIELQHTLLIYTCDFITHIRLYFHYTTRANALRDVDEETKLEASESEMLDRKFEWITSICM